MKTVARFLLLLVALSGSACVFIFNRVEVDPIDLDAQPVAVESPVKVHLTDGSTVIFPNGMTITGDTVEGSGERYDLTLTTSLPITSLSLDDVVAMESFRTEVDRAKTVLVSAATSVAAVALGALAAVAIFGSCPTIYSDAFGETVLEAEAFSYSIAPLFEARDVDRLTTRADPSGTVSLEVRNEALETHYLNHLELLEVIHEPHELVLPDHQGRAIVVGTRHPAGAIVDRAGRDLRRTLAVAADGEVFSTAAATLQGASETDLMDYIDLEFPAPVAADEVALVLRLRNSLLNTVLLYDVMLGGQGARALDWVGQDLERIGPAMDLALWYTQRMGLRVAVWEDGDYREVARIPDSGPIAYTDVAVLVPVPPGDVLRIRLSFVADSWHIDKLAIATAVRRPTVRSIPIERVVASDGTEDFPAQSSLRAPDESYLQTTPGQKFSVHFDVGPPPLGRERTFLLASQGYYIEWIRHDWITTKGAVSFTASDATLYRALLIWEAKRDTLRQRFEATRIPVR